MDLWGTQVSPNYFIPHPTVPLILGKTIHQFLNLENGSYKIFVKDNNSSLNESQNINIDFVADLNGSTCCPDHLIIPASKIQGNFNALESISMVIGAEANQGTSILICSQ